MPVDGWVDVHAHFNPPRPAELNEAVVQVMRQACWCVDEAPVWSPEETLDYMDRAGIQMQLLSNIPKTLPELRLSNDFGAALVRSHPRRFGLLAALPSDDPGAALGEIDRARDELGADGFAVTCRYNGVYLGDPVLEPVWEELDKRRAAVFVHPDAYLPGSEGRPAALIEVAFETARTVADMLYAGTFRRFPHVTFVIAHCGGALTAVAGRLLLLGLESWVPNPHALSEHEMGAHLRALHLDTAATSAPALAAALAMTTPDKLVFGSDCGVACTNEGTMSRSIATLRSFEGLSEAEVERIGRNALRLFPGAARRLDAVGATP